MLLGIFNSRLFRNVSETAKGIYCIAKMPICTEWPWLYDIGTYEKGKDSIKAVSVGDLSHIGIEKVGDKR